MDGRAKLNLAVLSSGAALSFSGVALLTTSTALAGRVLADDPALATLPFAIQITANMAVTVPASLLMGRIGRKAGFMIGQLLAFAGGGIGLYAILVAHSFLLLCISGAFVGAHVAFYQYYRFAAVETTEEAYHSRAISWVLAGGVAAALLGPELAKISVDWFAEALYAGTYLAFMGLNVANMIVLLGLRMPKPAKRAGAASGRPLAEIAGQPTLIVAVLAAMTGYALMVLVMTATPLAMDVHGHSFDDAAFVIQWHVFAMFAPSFFTGHLIRRFGVTAIILVGCLFCAAAMTMNLMGIDVMHFWGGLFAIGVGWNFMFIGGTTLLTETYRAEEKSKVQALNDFCVFGTSAAASFLAGYLQSEIGWHAVNWAVGGPLVVVFIACFWLRLKRRSAIAGTA